MPIRISIRQIERVLVGVAAVLVGAHIAVQCLRFLSGDESLGGLVYFFSLGAETNLPSFYASLLLITAALASAVAGGLIVGAGKIMRWYWFGLAGVFGFLAVDEVLAIHERLIEPVRSVVDTSGLFYYAWVIPYGVATIVFAVLYIRFLKRLPKRTSLLIVLAGATYVGGALVLEMIGGWLSERSGNGTVLYVSVQSLEEIMELSGVLLFIHAVLSHTAREVGGVLLQVGDPTPVDAPSGSAVPLGPTAPPSLAAASRRTSERDASARP